MEDKSSRAVASSLLERNVLAKKTLESPRIREIRSRTIISSRSVKPLILIFAPFVTF